MESLAVYEIASKKDMRQEYATVKKVATIIIINITNLIVDIIITSKILTACLVLLHSSTDDGA